MKKRGMTLAEVLVVFVIMGIIASIAFMTVKPYEKNLRHVYHRVYHALGTAFYNANITSFPDTATGLCQALIQYLNVQSAQCEAVGSEVLPIDVNAPDFGVAPAIIASNGVRLWIGYDSGRAADKDYSVLTGEDGGTYSIKYFWIIADLNGTSAPNSAVENDKYPADIVGFILTEDYEVIPMGRPEVDARYLLARVVYTNEVDTNNLSENLKSSNMTYYEARRHAYGIDGGAFERSANESATLDFSTNLLGTSPFKYVIPADFPARAIGADAACKSSHEVTTEPENPDDPPVTETVTEVDPDACYIEVPDYY